MCVEPTCDLCLGPGVLYILGFWFWLSDLSLPAVDGPWLTDRIIGSGPGLLLGSSGTAACESRIRLSSIFVCVEAFALSFLCLCVAEDFKIEP